jgi:hypothetical protein
MQPKSDWAIIDERHFHVCAKLSCLYHWMRGTSTIDGIVKQLTR